MTRRPSATVPVVQCHSSDERPGRGQLRYGPAALMVAASFFTASACSSSGLESAATSTSYRGAASGSDASVTDGTGPESTDQTGPSGTSGVSGISGELPPWDDPTNTTTPGMYGPDASIPLTTGTLPIDPPAESIAAFFQAIGYGDDLSTCYQKAYLGTATEPVDSRRMAELAADASTATKQLLLKCDRTYPKQFPTTIPAPAATAPTAAPRPTTTAATSSAPTTTAASTGSAQTATSVTDTTGK